MNNLRVEIYPSYEKVDDEFRPCANIHIYYNDKEVNLNDTIYQYYFDDEPVISFNDVTNISTGTHNFKVVVTYKNETKIANVNKTFSKYSSNNGSYKPKTKKNSILNILQKQVISTKRFKPLTAEIGQVYYTNTIVLYKKYGTINKILEFIEYCDSKFHIRQNNATFKFIRVYNNKDGGWTTNEYDINSFENNLKIESVIGISIILPYKCFFIKTSNEKYSFYKDYYNGINNIPYGYFKKYIYPKTMKHSMSPYGFAIQKYNTSNWLLHREKEEGINRRLIIERYGKENGSKNTYKRWVPISSLDKYNIKLIRVYKKPLWKHGYAYYKLRDDIWYLLK